ncbi:MauE/DoxX family redox-associated membrane protein [Arhodomonas sp. SL1]|uniref:MauE/DoxX family redox-associated membrane protein n=1 Tax=Arhodomonas sp. SL1 TaxID=3425691 RepID=UPI003F882972
MIDPVLSGIAQGVVAVLLLAAAVYKLRDLRGFRATLREYDLLAEVLVRPVAWLIPVAEVAAAAALVYGPTRVAGGTLAAVLFAVFTLAIAVNLARGRRDIDCGCFGPSRGQQLSGWLLPRNLLLVALSALAGLPPAERALGALDYFTVAAGVVAFVLFFVVSNVVIGLAPQTAALRRHHD